MRKPIEFADLDWDDQGHPRSRVFDDIYFFKANSNDLNGLAESRYVFLQHNKLAERWQAIRDSKQTGSSFVIGETGFGTGLNFLAAWQLWDQFNLEDTNLHYVSVEKYPLRPSDLKKALSAWPELEVYATQLLLVYPSLLAEGFFSLAFPNSNLYLSFIVGDVVQGLEQCLHSTHPHHCLPFGRGVDAWFLDGFAPRTNPEMWTAEVFQCIAKLSHSDTSLATFTATSAIQGQLKANGFAVEKVKGFGNKREMLRASYQPKPELLNSQPLQPVNPYQKYPLPWSVIPYQKPGDKVVAIIGAGLAGCHSARALADLGWQVQLFDTATAIADGASGNAQGIVFGKLSADDDALAQFNLAALLVAAQHYSHVIKSDSSLGQRCGVLQLAYNEKEQRILQQCREYFSQADMAKDIGAVHFVDANVASEIAGVDISTSAMYFPNLGWINPKQLCAQLIDHPLVHLHLRTTIDSLQYNNNTWSLIDADNNAVITCDKVIIANAHNASHFEYTRHLPLKKIRGQISYLDEANCLTQIKAVICGESYIAPFDHKNNCQSLGATFNLQAHDLTLTEQDHTSNISSVATFLPNLAPFLNAIDVRQLSGRAQFRCTSPDYLPLVGPVHDHNQFIADYGKLRVNANAVYHGSGRHWPGLYINVGHGSRGLAYTPLCARLLAALINGDPLPVSRFIYKALHPGRFTIRGLIRRQL